MQCMLRFLEAIASLEVMSSITQSLSHIFANFLPDSPVLPPDGSVWPHMVLYGPIRFHMVPNATAWFHMVLDGPIWSCVVPYGPLWVGIHIKEQVSNFNSWHQLL